jgi:hypothetical protein
MQITQLWAQTLTAILGGLACELLHWYSLSRKPSGAARFARHPVYWITTLGMILFAGAMPLLYLEGTSSALLCFHLGAATPILLQKLIASAPHLTRSQGAGGTGDPTFVQFFGW